MKINYRMAIPEDRDALAAFWSENANWDIINGEEWDNRFINTPFGASEVAVATEGEDQKIVAQFIFIPAKMVINGKETLAFRPYAPVLAKDLQMRFGIQSFITGKHPIVRMYNRVTEALASKGVPLVYLIPDPRWSRVLKAYPFFMTHRFPLWSHPLPLVQNIELDSSISFEKINASDPMVDSLWGKASGVYKSALVRNSRTLPWKTRNGKYQTYAIKNNGEIIGLFCVTFKKEDHQWLICDMLTTDNESSLEQTMKAACKIIEKEDQKLDTDHPHERKIAILTTPAMEPIISQVGFHKDNYNFTLAIQTFNLSKNEKQEVAPENWYVCAND